MSNNATDSTHAEPYRFTATAILDIEPYQPASVVPEWANPRRISALVRALRAKVSDREPAAWDPWLSDVAEQWPVALALGDYMVRKTPDSYSYEVGRTFALQVFVENRQEAQTIAHECFEAGTDARLFEFYNVDLFDAADANPVLADEFDRLAANYGPIAGGYEPAFPEIVLGSPEDKEAIAGVIRVDLSRAQLEAIVDRAREYLQTDGNESESFDLGLSIRDRETSDRLLSAAEAVVDEEGVVRVVSIADEEPAAVSLVFLPSEADAQRLLEYVSTIPDPIYEDLGLPVWHHELSAYMTDQFVGLAETAFEREVPGVVNHARPYIEHQSDDLTRNEDY